jgi:hypothetical protein
VGKASPQKSPQNSAEIADSTVQVDRILRSELHDGGRQKSLFFQSDGFLVGAQVGNLPQNVALIFCDRSIAIFLIENSMIFLWNR